MDEAGSTYILSNRDTGSYINIIVLTKYSTDGVRLWEQIYVGSLYSDPTAVTIKYKDGFLYVGGTEYAPGSSKDYLLMKYDTSGSPIRTSHYHSLPLQPNYFSDMQFDNDNFLYLTGGGQLQGDPYYPQDVLTFKVDTAGQVIRSGYVTYPLDSNQYDTPLFLRIDQQNNLIISGSIQSSDIVKMDSSLNVNWIGPPSVFSYDASDMVIDDSSNYYLISKRFNQIVKYDSSGNIIWNKPVFAGHNCALVSAVISGNKIYAAGNCDTAGIAKCFTARLDFNGTIEWYALSSVINGYKEFGSRILLDNNSNLVVIGQAFDTLNILDIIILKYDSSGSLMWQNSFDDSMHARDEYVDAAIDSAGNVSIGCSIYNYRESFAVINFNASGVLKWTDSRENFQGSYDRCYKLCRDLNGNLISSGISFSRTNTYDLLIAKFNSNGSPVWTKRIGSPNSNISLSQMILDKEGNIYICGSVPPALNTGNDMYIAKINSGGNLVYMSYYGTLPNNDFAASIALDDSKNIYVLGSRRDSINFSSEILLKYDSTGSFLWEKVIADSANSWSAENLIYSGNESLYLAFTKIVQPGMTNMCVAKIDTSGTIFWKSVYNSPTSLKNNEKKLAIDLNGNSIVTGFIDSSGWGTFVNKFDPAGILVWSGRVPNYGTGLNYPADVSIDEMNNIYVLSRVDSGLNNISYMITVSRFNENGDTDWSHNYLTTAPFSFSEGMGIVAQNGVVAATGRIFDNNSKSNFLTLIYDTTGNLIYTDLYPSTGAVNENEGFDILMDSTGCIYVAGNNDTQLDMTDYLIMKYCPVINDIKSKEPQTQIDVYPNPATYMLNIVCRSNELLKIEVRDLQGRILLQQRMDKNYLQIDVSKFSTGMYFVSVFNKGTLLQTKKVNILSSK